MASAKFSIGQVNITDYLRIIARETANPTAEVVNLLYPPPQPTTRNIVITDLNPVMHYFDFYECSGESDNPGVLLSTFTIDVGLINQTALEFIEFVVDGPDEDDPPSGTTEYSNSLLDGADYQVNQRGVGPRSFESEITPIAGGGFKLLNGETFQTGDRWFISVAHTVTTTPPVISKGLFKDIIEFNTNITITSSHFNCILEANASAAIVTVTFPSLSIIPDDTLFGFNTHFGAQRYVAIQLASGEKIRFQGAEKNITWLGKREMLLVIKKGSLLKVFDYDGDYSRVGMVVKSNIQPPNTLPDTGGWYNIADYPRFYYEYVSQIPSGQLSAVFGSTVTERTKFAINGSQFWMPDTGGYFERNVDPNGDVDTDRTQRYSGSTQKSAVQKHKHAFPYGNNPDAIDAAFGSAGYNNKYGINQHDNDNDYWYTNDGSELTGAIQMNDAGVVADETRSVNVAINSWRII